jgi:outer membrane protein
MVFGLVGSGQTAEGTSRRAPLVLPQWWAKALGKNEMQRLSQPAADSCQEAIRRAVLRHPTLAAAGQQLPIASSGVAQARAGLLPQLNLAGRAQRQEEGSPTATTDTRTAGLNASQSLIDVPAWLGVRSSLARARAARYSFVDAYQSFVHQVLGAYLQVLESRDAAALSRANFDLAAAHQHASEQRQQAGELTRTDVDQAQARAAAAEAEWLTAASASEAAALILTELTGDPPAAALPVPVLPALTAPPADLLPPPAVQAALASRQAAAAQAAAVQAQSLPVVALNGSVTRTWAGPAGDPAVRNDERMASLNLSVPVFRGGDLRAQRQQAGAARDLAQAELDRQRLLAERDVRTQWLQLTAARQALDLYQAAVVAARAAAEGVDSEFAAGTATTLQVLDAQDRLFANQLALVRGRYAVLRLQAQLLLATGQLTLEALNDHR